MARRIYDADGNLVPRYLSDPRIRAAQEEEVAHGIKLGSSYQWLLESYHCEPGDLRAAREYLHKIELVIQEGGWSHYEFDRLYKLRKKWKIRAAGLDPRFMSHGTRPGRAAKRRIG